MLKFRGIPYLAFGYGSQFTSRRHEIEKTWYLKDGWRYPIILKSYIINPHRRYTNKFLKKIKDHPNLKLLVNFFNDFGEVLDEYEYDIGKELPQSTMLVVRDSKDQYAGVPESVDHLLELEELTSANTGNVICAGFNPKTSKWCGWSHRAKACFGLGDKVFEEDFGGDHTIFTEHGTETIETCDQAKQSALNFARYVS